MCENTRPVGSVAFVGAGPGAPDLLTVRGARRIAGADVVLWPSGAMDVAAMREHAAAGAELVDCARLPLEELLRVYRRAATHKLAVARVIAGDAALWSGLRQEHDACRRLGLLIEIVPGVSALAAVLAAGGRELTEPSVLVTRLDGTPAAASDAGMLAVMASAARADALVERLRAAGRDEDTPVVVGYKTGRPDELLLTTTLGELEATVKLHRLWSPAVFLVGQALSDGRARVLAVGAGVSPARGDDQLRRPYRRRRGTGGANRRGSS